MEITHKNFRDVLPSLEKSIKSCDFICIDTEFTGLEASPSQSANLFDGSAERYTKHRKSVQQFTLSQIGLACFTKDSTYNKYLANVYNIFVFPQTFGTNNNNFLCQISTLEFLRKNNFNFNKFVYEGVPFLNKTETSALCNKIENGLLEDEEIDESFLQNLADKILNWQNLNEKSIEIDYDEMDLIKRYLVAYEIMKLIPNVRVDVSSSLCKLKVTKALNSFDESEEKTIFFAQLKQEIGGCAVLFDILVEAKKPVIGQNMFYDVLFLYEKFYEPLPEKYEIFKRNVHKMFPCIIDTKQIALSMKQILCDRGCTSFSLNGLYNILESKHDVKFLTLYQPHVELTADCQKYDNDQRYFHEAGYDAYIVGVIFIRMSHIAANSNVSSADAKPLNFALHLSAVKQWTNRVNLIKAAVPFINLAGDDPVANRPQWLAVTARGYAASIDQSQLSKEFSAIGHMDVLKLSNRRALIAVATYESAKLLLEKYRNDKYFKIERYSFLRHTNAGRALVWSSTAFAVATSVFIITRKQIRDWLNLRF